MALLNCRFTFDIIPLCLVKSKKGNGLQVIYRGIRYETVSVSVCLS